MLDKQHKTHTHKTNTNKKTEKNQPTNQKKPQKPKNKTTKLWAPLAHIQCGNKKTTFQIKYT